ncbi:MAG: hypothetical protein DI573_13775 [Microbacterium sp.]|uniref:ABC transporter permease n=1 Tax=Microbacterium sp. TaxID=51671 RepID=UPI000DB7186B|nr:ABC transporter permease [Microbacterium sp.]PZU36389.1 MAG: hypothetical protein DI573_13775 [Microbacterium sp.]
MAEVLTSGVTPGRTFASSSKTAARTSVSVLRRIAAILAYIIVGLLIWQGFIVAFDVDPLVVPGPIPVIESLAMQLTSPVIWAATWVTFQEAIFGFGIGAAVGILIAIVLSESRLLYKLINPYIVAFQAIPKVALTPLFIVWFGFGIWSKVVLIATFTFFPVMVNMYQGLRSTSNEEEELMRVSHATRWQRFRHLRLYRSLPYLFAASRHSRADVHLDLQHGRPVRNHHPPVVVRRGLRPCRQRHGSGGPAVESPRRTLTPPKNGTTIDVLPSEPHPPDLRPLAHPLQREVALSGLLAGLCKVRRPRAVSRHRAHPRARQVRRRLFRRCCGDADGQRLDG